MFGFRYIKFDPTQHVIVHRGGEVKREGPGLAFWYFAPSTTLVAVPLGSSEAHFIFEETTLDYQQVTIQGQVTYRISDPKKAAALLNHTLDGRGQHYVSQDPEKLPQRVVTAVNVLAKARVQNLSLREAMTAGERLVAEIREELSTRPDIQSLGLEILGLSILAIKPNPDTARALEAGTREALLQEADDAIFIRRNASVEHERSIKENELRTEQAVQEKRHQIEKADTAHRIGQEERRRALVELEAGNARTAADARAYALAAVVKALAGADPKLVQVLAQARMKPDALVAAALGEFAANAEKIGEVQLSSELLRDLLRGK